MKILALNSSPLKDRGNTAVILNAFLEGTKVAGAEVEPINIFGMDIRPCLGKLVCWISTPGKCCQDDDMSKLIEKLKNAEVWVFASPLYWDGVTGPMKNVIDRLLPLIVGDISVINGHCRHALRDGVSGGKIVLISTCGFWELDNFESMVNHIKAVSKNIHREFAGALLRPHGAQLKYQVKQDQEETWFEVLKASKTAGSELIKNGFINKETLQKISQEIFSRDEYMKLINENFDRLIKLKN